MRQSVSRAAFPSPATPPARLAVALGVGLALAACGQSVVVRREPPAPGPAAARPAPASRPAPTGEGEHVVVRGDTLYGIAFRAGLDFRDVAAWNGIPAPYTIYPGQRLRLHPPGAALAAGPAPGPAPVAARPAAPPTSAVPAAPRPAPGVEALPPEPIAGATPPPPAGAPRPTGLPDAPAVPPPGATGAPGAPATAGAPARGAVTGMPVVPTATPTPAPAPVAAAPAPAAPSPAASATAPRNVSSAGWRWPAVGQIVGRFVAGDPTKQGLDIGGSAGQPVFAAGDGTVVYSGAGLVGYGELVIIKHSDEWLSAYGHNRRRLVNEGDRVRSGQPIAEMGRSGASRDMLHFEIRRNGRPVDPLPLLPRQP